MPAQSNKHHCPRCPESVTKDLFILALEHFIIFAV